MMGSTTFGMQQMPQEEAMSAGQVRAMLRPEEGSDGRIPAEGMNFVRRSSAKITAWGRNVVGSPGYWWGKREECAAKCRNALLKNNQLPIVFHSCSMAEYHWPEVHRIFLQIFNYHDLPDYAKAVEDLAVGRECAADQASKLKEILQRYPAILNQIFVNRTESWFQIVLKEGLGIDEYWYRYEFAKSRGTIHFHSLIWKSAASLDIHSLLQRAVSATNMVSLVSLEQEAADEMESVLSQYFTHITAEHPSGRERSHPEVPCRSLWYTNRIRAASGHMDPLDRKKIVVGEDVAPDQVGNVDRWPIPEGIAEEPSSKCLRTKLFEIHSEEETIVDRENFANRVLLHKCSSYCLRPLSKPKDGSEPVYTCRMYFGTENKLLPTRTDGKPAQSRPCIVLRKGVSYWEASRDHPRLVQGPILLSRAWGGNMDWQPILALEDDIWPGWPDVTEMTMTKDFFDGAHFDFLNDQARRQVLCSRKYFNKDVYCDRLIDYVVAYACKNEMAAAETSKLFLKLLKDASISDSTPFTSLARRLNMKVLKTRSIPASEADFLLQGLQNYHSSSGSVVRVSLHVGQRIVNSEDGSVRDNKWDTFLKEKKASKIAKATTFDTYVRQDPKTHVPTKIVPLYQNCTEKPTWPLQDEFCRTKIVLHAQKLETLENVKGPN